MERWPWHWQEGGRSKAMAEQCTSRVCVLSVCVSAELLTRASCGTLPSGS